MSYSEKANNYANLILERRREANAQATLKKRQEIAVKCNNYTDLETYRRELNIRKLKASLQGDKVGMEHISKELQGISNEIKTTLANHGFSIKDLDDIHTCYLCGDTGITKDGSVCVCKNNLMREYELDHIQKVSPLSLSSFESFDLSYYSHNKINGFIPYDVMKGNLKDCVEFSKRFPCSDNLLLMGNTGLGKTHLALSIANEVLKKGYEVVYCSCSNILQIIDEERTENRYSSTLTSLKRCDLLILDDLGSEYINAYYISMLYDILNSRISEQLSTVITTNFNDYEKLKARYGDKIASRLIGCFKVLPCIGDDIRINRV